MMGPVSIIRLWTGFSVVDGVGEAIFVVVGRFFGHFENIKIRVSVGLDKR